MSEQKKQLEALFARWANRGISENGDFIKDGCYFAKEGNAPYFEQDFKVLFVLKEVRKDQVTGRALDGGGSLFPYLLKAGNDQKTYGNIAKWSQQILNGFVPNQPWRERVESLKKVAVLNVKKWAGNAKANPNEIWNHIEQYQQEIREEVSILRPNLIFACGDFWDALEQFGIVERTKPDFERLSNVSRKQDKNQKQGLWGEEKIPVIHYHHPCFCWGNSLHDMIKLRELYIESAQGEYL